MVRVKDATGCFLCAMPVKAKRFTFYSGIMKGGSTTRLLRHTITVLEHWQNLTMHEIQVCRWCQTRLWRKRQLLPIIFFGAGAAVMFVAALAGLVLLAVDVLFAVVFTALAVLVALVLTGVLAVFLWRCFLAKPSHAQLEPLILAEAVGKLPDRGHTYMTTEQYV